MKRYNFFKVWNNEHFQDTEARVCTTNKWNYTHIYMHIYKHMYKFVNMCTHHKDHRTIVITAFDFPLSQRTRNHNDIIWLNSPTLSFAPAAPNRPQKRFSALREIPQNVWELRNNCQHLLHLRTAAARTECFKLLGNNRIWLPSY